MRRVTVEQWIAEALADSDKPKPCNAIALVYARQMGIGIDEVHTKEIQGTTVSSKQLAELFINKACAYSQDLTGLQTFRLLAFYGANEPQASFTFTIFEGALTAGEKAPWSKHEPTANGFLAQLMKHNEAIMGDYTGLVKGVIGMFLTERQEIQAERMEMNVIMRDVLLNLRKEDHAMTLEQK